MLIGIDKREYIHVQLIDPCRNKIKESWLCKYGQLFSNLEELNSASENLSIIAYINLSLWKLQLIVNLAHDVSFRKWWNR